MAVERHVPPAAETLQLEWLARKHGWRMLAPALAGIADSSPLVREGAIIALEIALEDVLHMIAELTTDEFERSEGVRDAARELLENFGRPVERAAAPGNSP